MPSLVCHDPLARVKGGGCGAMYTSIAEDPQNSDFFFLVVVFSELLGV